MNRNEEAMLNRAIRAQQALAGVIKSGVVHIIDEKSIVVPQRTLLLIEPESRKWDYRPAKGRPGYYWASAYFNDAKFECLLSPQAHYDLGGHGIQ